MHPNWQVLGSNEALNLLTLALVAVDKEEVQRLRLTQNNLESCPVETSLERNVRDLALHLEFALALVSVVKELL